MPFVTDDGVELFVKLDGRDDAPALFLVNGAFCAVPVWDNLIGSLTSRFRVIRHDVRGTGRSKSGDPAANTFERYAADVAGLAEQLGVERIHLWGMAWGARVALVTAARHPSRINRLVLSDLAIDPADVEAQRAGAKSAAAARAEAGIAEAPKPKGWNDHDDIDAATSTMAATKLHPDLADFAEQVSAPTLILTGDHDPNLLSSRRALPYFSNARLEVAQHCGHGIVRQRPEMAADTVTSFLNNVPRIYS